MRATHRTVPFAMALAVLLGCGDSPEPAPRATQSPALPATTAPAGGFSVTDTAWLQLAIAMDERALKLLDLMPTRAADPALKDLSRRLASEHRAELARLRALHTRSGGPTTNPHEGHDMPGMATAATLAALEKASGADATHIFTTAMRAHLDQSIQLARSEQKSGTEPEARALAAEIEAARTDQRGRLDAL